MITLRLLAAHWQAITILVLLIVVNVLLHKPAAAITNGAPLHEITHEETHAVEHKDVQVKAKTAAKTTTTTTTKKPDGTVTTTETTSVADTTTDATSDDNAQTSESNDQVVDKYSPTRYSAEVTTNPRDYKDFKVGVAVRVGDTPVSGVVEYAPKNTEIRIGVRADF